MKSRNMLVLGILIIAFGTWVIHESNRLKNSETIQKLEDTISQKDAQLQKKSDSIKDLTQEVLGFSKNIDDNTSSIKELTKKIKGLSTNTNEISKAIQNEQKEKGEIRFNVKDSEYYTFHLGGNTENVAKKLLVNVYQLQMLGNQRIPIFLQLKNNTILISTSLRDIQNELVVELNKGRWALNKSNNFSINYDESGLEIIDKRGLVNLQIDIYRSNLYFKGILYFDNYAIVFDKGLSFLRYKDPNFLNELYAKGSDIKRIFKHTGTNYLGKRNDEFLERRNQENKEYSRIENKVNDRKSSYSKKSKIELLDIAKILVLKINELTNKIDQFSMEIFRKEDFSTKRDYYLKELRKLELDIISEFKEDLLIESITLRKILFSKIQNYNKKLILINEYNDVSSLNSLKSIQTEIEELAKAFGLKK